MTPETATSLLAKMVSIPECSLCHAKNPPTSVVVRENGATIHVHDGCRKYTGIWYADVRDSGVPLLDEDDCRDALTTVAEQAATIARLERELAARDAAPPAIASLRELAIQAFSTDLAADVDFDSDSDVEGLSSEEPRIVLAYNLERTATPWQAMLTFDGGMGGEVLTAGNNEATPEGAVESLRAAITPETQQERP